MGAFDTYAGTAHCPRCDDVHYVDGQTKVFDPDFGGLCHRHFTPGRTQALDFPPSQMLEGPVWDDWCRIRTPSADERIAILVDFDETLLCSCGCPMAVILCFVLSPEEPSATLESIELLDAIDSDVAGAVDLANGEDIVAWHGDYSRFSRDLQALAASSPEARCERLRAALAERFEGHERWLDPPEADSPSTIVVGPMRCEACGEQRHRRVQLVLGHPSLDHSLLGEGWTGGELRPGTRIHSSMTWRERDEDRAYFVRLRHPLPGRSLTICGGRETWGCPCGVGRANVVLRFSIDDDGATLREIRLRVLRGRKSLRDLDFIHAPGSSRTPTREPSFGWRPADRAEAIDNLLRRMGLDPS